MNLHSWFCRFKITLFIFVFDLFLHYCLSCCSFLFHHEVKKKIFVRCGSAKSSFPSVTPSFPPRGALPHLCQLSGDTQVRLHLFLVFPFSSSFYFFFLPFNFSSLVFLFLPLTALAQTFPSTGPLFSSYFSVVLTTLKAATCSLPAAPAASLIEPTERAGQEEECRDGGMKRERDEQAVLMRGLSSLTHTFPMPSVALLITHTAEDELGVNC